MKTQFLVLYTCSSRLSPQEERKHTTTTIWPFRPVAFYHYLCELQSDWFFTSLTHFLNPYLSCQGMKDEKGSSQDFLRQISPQYCLSPPSSLQKLSRVITSHNPLATFVHFLQEPSNWPSFSGEETDTTKWMVRMKSGTWWHTSMWGGKRIENSVKSCLLPLLLPLSLSPSPPPSCVPVCVCMCIDHRFLYIRVPGQNICCNFSLPLETK